MGRKRRHVRRRIGITISIVVFLLVIGSFYGGTQLLLGRHVAAPMPEIRALKAPLDVAEGERIARITGCTACHGDNGGGRILTEYRAMGRVVASPLARAASDGTQGQLARAIRSGVGIDARPLYFMQTQGLNRLADEDVSRLLGWMNALPKSAFLVAGRTSLNIQGRAKLLLGQLPESTNLAGGQPKRRPADTGRYMTEIACSRCHALDSDRPGDGDGALAPGLRRAAAGYDPVTWQRLLRTGQARDGRDLATMREAGRAGLDALTGPEAEAIRVHLAAR